MNTYTTTLFLVSLTFSSFCQTRQSPDERFSFIISSKDFGDHILWKGSLIDLSTKDTVLIIDNKTHDEPAPVAFWNQDGSRLAFHEEDTIKVYNHLTQRIVYSEPGMIWNSPENFFDPKNDILFFLKSSGSSHEQFDLYSLNIKTLKKQLVKSFITSGDSLTGIPSIMEADFDKRQLLVVIESKDWKGEKFVVKY